MTLQNLIRKEIKQEDTILSNSTTQQRLVNFSKAIKTKEIILSKNYPDGIDLNMIILVENQRFKYFNEQWFQIPKKYKNNLREILRIPLSNKIAIQLRKKVSGKIDSMLTNPTDFQSAVIAREIARDVLPKRVLRDLDRLLWDNSEYISVVIDNLFAGWRDFDIDNTEHQQIALAMKFVILSCTGEFRTPSECLRLVLTELGHEGRNGSRGSGVVFYEHTDGVHFSSWEEPDLLCLMGLSQPEGSPNTYISPVVEAISKMRPDYVDILSDKSNFEVTSPPSDKERHRNEWSPIQILFGQEQTKLIRLDVDLIRAKSHLGYLALGALQQALIEVRIPIQLTPGSLLLHRNNMGSHARGKNKADFNIPDLKRRRVFSRSYLANLRSSKQN